MGSGHETQKLSSFRSDKVFKLKRDLIPYFRSKIFTIFAFRIWNMAALVLKDLNDIEMFKSEIKK